MMLKEFRFVDLDVLSDRDNVADDSNNDYD